MIRPRRLNEIFVLDVYEEVDQIKGILGSYTTEELPPSSELLGYIGYLISTLISNQTVGYPLANVLSDLTIKTEVLEIIYDGVKDSVLRRIGDYGLWGNDPLDIDVEISVGFTILIKKYYPVATIVEPIGEFEKLIKESLENGDYVPSRLRSLVGWG